MILENFFIVCWIFFFFTHQLNNFIFQACRIVNIHLFNNNNNNNDNALNECFVDLESENDVKDALKKTNLTMGNRYVERKLLK